MSAAIAIAVEKVNTCFILALEGDEEFGLLMLMSA
jgi:hypothetical protein